MSRFKEGKVALDTDAVRQFFEQRGMSINAEHPLTSILYQDSHPEIAAERDLYERNLITPLLDLRPDSAVLDIGCGIGRWASAPADRSGPVSRRRFRRIASCRRRASA